jgi:hypothetical protein
MSCSTPSVDEQPAMLEGIAKAATSQRLLHHDNPAFIREVSKRVGVFIRAVRDRLNNFGPADATGDLRVVTFLTAMDVRTCHLCCGQWISKGAQSWHRNIGKRSS